MSQPTMQLPSAAVAFAQEQHAFRRSEDRELRKMRRTNSTRQVMKPLLEGAL
jgi:hypothetical protein